MNSIRPSIAFPLNACHAVILAVLFSFAWGNNALHAQNTSPADTAAGAGVKATPSVAPAAEAPAQAPGASLLSNGDFAAATKDPKSPDNWVPGAGNLITLESDAGKPFLRLVSQRPGELVEISQTIDLPPSVKGLVYQVSYRDQNQFLAGFLSCGRTVFRFLDAQGETDPAVPPKGDMVFDSHAKVWTDVTKGFLVPQGAVKVEMDIMIDKAKSGTLDVTDIRLQPMDNAQADALIAAADAEAANEKEIAAEAVKKRNADLAVVQQILALPSISPEIKVSGNKLVTANGTAVWLQGVNVPSLEWSAKGENILESIKVAIDEWKANVIRLPMNYD